VAVTTVVVTTTNHPQSGLSSTATKNMGAIDTFSTSV
jgi:hypothetical protein